MTKANACRTCGIDHDDDLHAAVTGIHEWFRGRITLALTKVEPGKPKVQRTIDKAPA